MVSSKSPKLGPSFPKNPLLLFAVLAEDEEGVLEGVGDALDAAAPAVASWPGAEMLLTVT